MFGKERGEVEYSLTELSECSIEGCNSCRTYGVEELHTTQSSNGITTNTERNKTEYCPRHSPDSELAHMARQKEHEESREQWRRRKEKMQTNELKSIIDAKILPTFDFYDGRLKGPRDRLKARIDGYEESKELLQRAKLDIPVMVYKSYPLTYAVIDTDGSVIEEQEVSPDSRVSLEEFRESYGGYEYVDRDYYDIQTNILTGVDINTPAHKLNEYVDRVVELHEYLEKQDPIIPEYCPACRDDHVYESKVVFSRMIINGEETIIPAHTRCGNFMGRLNPKFIDRDAYDFKSNC